MEEFPSNSRRPKAEPQEEKKIERVVTGEIVRRKKPLGKRMLETFVGGDDAHSVWSYVIREVLVPAAKDMMSDAVSQGIDRMLFGESRGRSSVRNRGSASYTSYNHMGRSQGNPLSRVTDSRREVSREARAGHDFDQILIDSRAEADEVLAKLWDALEQYQVVTVADMYDALGAVSTFVDQQWGWTDLRGSRVIRVRNKWLIDVPKPEPIN